MRATVWYIHVCIYGAYVYVCVYVCAYVYICMHMHIHVCICVCICICMCIFTEAAIRGYCSKWSSIVKAHFMCHSQERCPSGMTPPPIISANFGVTWSLTREVTSTEAFVKSLNWRAGEDRTRALWRGPSEVTPGSFHSEVNPGSGGWEWHFRIPPHPVLLWELIQTSSTHMFTRYWGMSGLQPIAIHHLEALCPQLEAENTWNCTLEEKKSIKSQKWALFRFQRWLGNRNNFEVGVVKPNEPVNAVMKTKERKKDTSLIVAMLSVNSHLLPSQKVEATQMSIYGHRWIKNKQNVVYVCVYFWEKYP